MATEFVTTNQTTTRIVNGGDELFIFDQVEVYVASDPAVEISNSGNSTFIAGSAFAGEEASIKVLSGAGQNSITISETGVVASGANSFFSAIELRGDNSVIDNFGFISGGSGITVSGGMANTVNNIGVVNGTFLSGIVFFNHADGVLNNSGEINGGISGVTIAATGSVTINNTGAILGDVGVLGNLSAILPGSAIDVVNLGEIIGVAAGIDFTSDSVADSLTNTGAIVGNVLLGGGADYLDSSGGTIDGIISAGAGNDTIIGSAGNDAIQGNQGRDLIITGAGDDLVQSGDDNDIIAGGLGSDTIDGGAGVDTLDYLKSASGVVVELWRGLGSAGDAAGDVYSRVESVIGSIFNDVLAGDSAANGLMGSFGNDLLIGGGGNDFLTGGPGNDTLIGQSGDDRFIFEQGFGADTIADFQAGAGTEDTLRINIGAAFDTFAEVQAVSAQVGLNVVINFGGGNAITLLNTQLADLHPDDFIFS